MGLHVNNAHLYSCLSPDYVQTGLSSLWIVVPSEFVNQLTSANKKIRDILDSSTQIKDTHPIINTILLEYGDNGKNLTL